MTYRIEAARHSAPRRLAAGAGVAAVILLGSACSNIYEGVGPPTTVPSISGGSANDTNTYPNLNIRPKVAGAQFTAAQEAASRSQLSAAASSAQSGVATTTVTPQSAARMNELAAKKGADVKKKIEDEDATQ